MEAAIDPSAEAEAVGCRWWRLFNTKQQELRLWTCLRSWRFAVLRKKRRFRRLSARESLELESTESDLPLHAVILFIHGNGDLVRCHRFQWCRLIVELAPISPCLQDSHRRIPLHYALQQKWSDQDELCWLMAKSEKMLLSKDSDGQSLITFAVQQDSADAIVILMAVEIARTALYSLQELLNSRHFESARRLCIRMVGEYFAGVPHFPHAFCLHLLRQKDALSIIDGMQQVWREFVDKWGYYGEPLLIDDLPTLRHAPMDSFLQLAVRAKGEPLSYQWFRDGDAVAGATQPTYIVSTCLQPHNEGGYHCEVSNWKGYAVSGALQLVVVDDKNGPDPSLRFHLSDDERASLNEGETVYRFTGTRGGLAAASLCGCSLLVPPKAFQSFNANGEDVSDSTGMETLIRCTTEGNSIRVARREHLVSPIVEVLPRSLPPLLQSAMLSIPHSWSRDDSLHELVAVEVANDGSYKDIDRPRVVEPRGRGILSFETKTTGRFAVITRPVPSQQRENERALETMRLYILHPDQLSSAQRTSVTFHVWLGLDRPDATQQIQQRLSQLQAQHNEKWSLASKALRLRAGQLLSLRIGRKLELSHMWEGDISSKMTERIQSDITVPLQDLEFDGHHGGDGDGTTAIFRALDVAIAIYKPNVYQSSKRPGNGKDSSAHGVLVSTLTWRLLLPVIHDVPGIPPQPTVHQRLKTQLALAYQRVIHSSSSSVRDLTVSATGSRETTPLFEELHEMERDFTPYFYLVEIARFNETFWQRYDRTWWFDKTKSEILLGMYKTAHAGVDPFCVIASDVYAGAIRVIQCSLDGTGEYSEPLLLEPPPGPLPDTNTDTKDGVDNDESESSVPSGLRTMLTLPGVLDRSAALHASYKRLRRVLSEVYATFPDFHALFEMERDVDSVVNYLERHRTSVRAANSDVALLILAMNRVERWIHERIYLGTVFFSSVWRRLRLLRRLIPEIDCFPNEYFSVTTGLHALMLELFNVIYPRASPGWLARLLLREWGEDERQSLLSHTTIRLLRTEAHTLQGSEDVLIDIEDAASELNLHSLEIEAEREALSQIREYLMLIVSQPQLLTARATVVQVASMLQLMLPSTLRVKTSIAVDDWHELVAAELGSDATKHAVSKLQEQDTLASHIRGTSPVHQERVPPHKVPSCISIRFGIHVLHVDVQHALKVMNASLRSTVQGQVCFSKAEKLMTFTPALPFDKYTQYHVKLRPQYVYTALRGGEAPLPATAAPHVFEFATVAL